MGKSFLLTLLVELVEFILVQLKLKKLELVQFENLL